MAGQQVKGKKTTLPSSRTQGAGRWEIDRQTQMILHRTGCKGPSLVGEPHVLFPPTHACGGRRKQEASSEDREAKGEKPPSKAGEVTGIQGEEFRGKDWAPLGTLASL